MISLDEIFGCTCLRYGGGHRPVVETAFVMAFDPYPEIPYFGPCRARAVWHTCGKYVYVATTERTD